MKRVIANEQLPPLGEGERERSRAWRTFFPEQKQRKEPRFPFCFQVQVRGTALNANAFVEHTNTSDISRSGCRILLQNRVARGSFLSLTAQLEDGRFGPECALYKVVWCQPEGDGYLVGAELVDGPNLWNITFPDFPVGGW